MSTDDDIELRDSIVEALEKNGALPKLRAQLRASVFLAIEERENKKIPFRNEAVEKLKGSRQGHKYLRLIMDFLACLKLDASASVFSAEAGMTTNEINRKELANELELSLTSAEIIEQKPILEILLEQRCASDKKDLPVDSFFTSSIANGVNDTFVKHRLKENARRLEKFIDDEFKPADLNNGDFFTLVPPFNTSDKLSIASTVTQRPKLSSWNSNTASNSHGKYSAVSGPGQVPDKHAASAMDEGSHAKLKITGFPTDLPDIRQKNALSPFPSLSDKENVLKTGRLIEDTNSSKKIDLRKITNDSDGWPLFALILDDQLAIQSISDSSRKSDNSNKPFKRHADTKRSVSSNESSKPGPARETVENKSASSGEDEKDSFDDEISEEIVEDLEVDDLLNSAQSSRRNSF